MNKYNMSKIRGMSTLWINMSSSSLGSHSVPWLGEWPQHAVSKLPCLVLSSARSCPSWICPGRLSTAWLVSLVVFSCHMVSKWWHMRSIGRLWGGWCDPLHCVLPNKPAALESLQSLGGHCCDTVSDPSAAVQEDVHRAGLDVSVANSRVLQVVSGSIPRQTRLCSGKSTCVACLVVYCVSYWARPANLGNLL